MDDQQAIHERREGGVARLDRDERDLHAAGLIEYYVDRDTGEPAYRHTEAAMRLQEAGRMVLTEEPFTRLLDAGHFSSAKAWVEAEAAKHAPPATRDAESLPGG